MTNASSQPLSPGTLLLPGVVVLYATNDLLVINKPAGMSVHRSDSDQDPNVVEAIREHVEDGDALRPGIVHRLDKKTSGLLLIARNKQTKQKLQMAFKERKITKRYLALTHKQLPNKQMLIEAPIARHSSNPFKREVSLQGKPAETNLNVLETIAGDTLVLLQPKTGRTHQLRVHMAYAGAPIVGDSMYGQPDPLLQQHFLHAFQLHIPAGVLDDQNHSFSAPLPAELVSYVQRNAHQSWNQQLESLPPLLSAV